MSNLPGRVVGEELRFIAGEEFTGDYRVAAVAIPEDEFDGRGEQFEKGEKVVLTRNPVEEAIEDVRGGENDEA